MSTHSHVRFVKGAKSYPARSRAVFILWLANRDHIIHLHAPQKTALTTHTISNNNFAPPRPSRLVHCTMKRLDAAVHQALVHCIIAHYAVMHHSCSSISATESCAIATVCSAQQLWRRGYSSAQATTCRASATAPEPSRRIATSAPLATRRCAEATQTPG